MSLHLLSTIKNSLLSTVEADIRDTGIEEIAMMPAILLCDVDTHDGRLQTVTIRNDCDEENAPKVVDWHARYEH